MTHCPTLFHITPDVTKFYEDYLDWIVGVDVTCQPIDHLLLFAREGSEYLVPNH